MKRLYLVHIFSRSTRKYVCTCNFVFSSLAAVREYSKCVDKSDYVVVFEKTSTINRNKVRQFFSDLSYRFDYTLPINCGYELYEIKHL